MLLTRGPVAGSTTGPRIHTDRSDDERAMLRFRRMHKLQKFSSVHPPVHNHFNQERHLISRQDYKAQRSAAFAEWRAVMS